MGSRSFGDPVGQLAPGEETGVHIIAGAGFYVDATHSSETRAKSVEQVSIKSFISWTIVVVVL